jgi:hypothetical protein
MAEIELSHLSRPCLGDHKADKATLINKVHVWNKNVRSNAKAHWQFTTEDARVKLSRLYPIISSDKALVTNGVSLIQTNSAR